MGDMQTIETVRISPDVCLSGYRDEYVFGKIKAGETFYEKDILDEWFLPHRKEMRVVYDIGANIGNHTVYFAHHASAARIFSFEPVPANYRMLVKNIENNRLDGQVTAYITLLGLLTFVISMGMLAYTVISWWIGRAIAGWSSVMCSVWAIGGLILLALGIIGEYIGKVYLETKARPRYFIKEILGDNNGED